MHRSTNFDNVVQTYVESALRGLPQMFDQNTGLFCYSFKKSGTGFVQEGRSHRYTLMTLLGMDRFERAGGRPPVRVKPVLDRLLTSLDWVNTLGDLGLLLWTCSRIAPDRLPEIAVRLQVPTALARYEGAKTGNSMELAWFLAGIAHWGLACPGQPSGLREVAWETHRKLSANQGAYGIFRHLGRYGSLRGRALGWMGSFADQVYPIYAYAKFAQAYDHPTALEEAGACARAICNAQGPLGQWCWHYDSESGEVTEGYPVFSVHQHAMGPMALFALEESAGMDFSPWIHKGLAWIAGNELDLNMHDASSNVIWRCIGRPRFKRSLDAALGRGMKPVRRGNPNQFRVLFECRPYELGWLLYAFAGTALSNRHSVRGGQLYSDCTGTK